MQYGFLKKWVQENAVQNLIFRQMEKFEDQYRIVFKNRKTHLQICLSNFDCFCFYSSKSLIPFSDKKELHQFNQNLAGAALQAVEIADSDRIIFVKFNKVDIYNHKNEFTLILEFIPHYQNIILSKEGIVIESIKKISFAQNRHRQILPGIKYELPSSSYEISEFPISYPLSLSSERKILPAEEGFHDMNSLFEKLFEFISQEREKNSRKTKISQIQKAIQQKEKKLLKLKAEFAQTSQTDSWKKQAELLKANFAGLKPGMECIRVTDYYQQEFPEIEIRLDAAKSARQNIEDYFKKYRKARDGKARIAEQIELTKKQIFDLEQSVGKIEGSTFLPEIKAEKKKPNTSPPESFKKLKIDENWEIYLGRTSRENDLLTTKFAKPHDWWFHTRIFRGTHVVLRNLSKKELPENLKILCCRLAAYYSKAKKSSNVPVDFTQIRFVRKPRGAAPGFVTYSNQKTLFVDPLSLREAREILQNDKDAAGKLWT